MKHLVLFGLIGTYAILSSKIAYGQDLNFISEYNRIRWPIVLGVGGGIIGDDNSYKRMALFHGHSISLQTGSNEPGIGNSRLYINASGAVGIGTTSPESQFNVVGSTPIMSTGGVGSGFKFRDWKAGATASDDWHIYASGDIARFHKVQVGDLMAITKTGNVGIGTTTPSSKLDVKGTATVDYLTVNPQNSSDEGGEISLAGAGNYPRWYIDSYQNRLRIFSQAEGLNVLANGRVGIGTGNPESTLHIESTSEVLATGSGAGFKFRNRNPNPASTNNDWVWYAVDNMARFHKVGIGDLMTFNEVGNLGIGTSTPGNFKLAVEGKIGAREVEVKTGSWADFVFESDYVLPTLQTVETHIHEKHHLPGIPSKAEIKKDGYALGAMDAKLLQKIEELTLYLIEQQKRIERLEERLNHKTR